MYCLKNEGNYQSLKCCLILNYFLHLISPQQILTLILKCNIGYFVLVSVYQPKLSINSVAAVFSNVLRNLNSIKAVPLKIFTRHNISGKPKLSISISLSFPPGGAGWGLISSLYRCSVCESKLLDQHLASTVHVFFFLSCTSQKS